MTDVTTSEQQLKSFVETILGKLGVGADDAARTAEVIVEADLRGVDSHGIKGFGGRVKDMQTGKFAVANTAKPLSRVGAMALYDGQQGYGPLLCSSLLPTVLELAEAHGIGMVLIRESSHWGCPAYYSRWMAARGFIGIAISNTNPAMPLWGSSAKSIGNNPMTIAAPRRGHEPIVLDMSMQQVSWGGLAILKEEGQQTPGLWGYDENGVETNDPGAIIKSGRVRPTGDHKGSGLAFMLEILTGVMAAGAICYEVGKKTAEGQPAHYCQTFIAMKPDVFAGAEGYADKLELLYATAKASPLATGFSEIVLPGDRSNATMADRRKNGIPIRRIQKAVEQLATEFAVPLPWEA